MKAKKLLKTLILSCLCVSTMITSTPNVVFAENTDEEYVYVDVVTEYSGIYDKLDKKFRKYKKYCYNSTQLSTAYTGNALFTNPNKSGATISYNDDGVAVSGDNLVDYSYDNKVYIISNRLTSYTDPNGNKLNDRIGKTYSYTWEDERIKTITEVPEKGTTYGVYTLDYDENGLSSYTYTTYSKKNNEVLGSSTTTDIKYDKHGYRVFSGYKNIYKNGKLVARKDVSDPTNFYPTMYKYKYKTIKILKKYEQFALAQQEYIINHGGITKNVGTWKKTPLEYTVGYGMTSIRIEPPKTEEAE